MTPFWPTFLAGVTFGAVAAACGAVVWFIGQRRDNAVVLPVDSRAKETACLDCNTVHDLGEPCPTCGRRENSILLDRLRAKKAGVQGGELDRAVSQSKVAV